MQQRGRSLLLALAVAIVAIGARPSEARDERPALEAVYLHVAGLG